jgi:hypothetical protein
VTPKTVEPFSNENGNHLVIFYVTRKFFKFFMIMLFSFSRDLEDVGLSSAPINFMFNSLFPSSANKEFLLNLLNKFIYIYIAIYLTPYCFFPIPKTSRRRNVPCRTHMMKKLYC